MTMPTAQYEATDESQVAKTKPTWGYYRQPDGFITASPATDLEELKYRREGWEPLNQYGRFEMATPWSANNPLEVLFMRGGAGELTVEQIVTQGLYLNPPKVPTCRQALGQNHKRHVAACLRNARPVTFPQLRGAKVDLGPFPCKVCLDREFPTEAARAQHTAVMHAAEKSDERTGQSLAEALVKGLAGVVPGAVRAEPEAPAAAAVAVAESPAQAALLTAMMEKMEALQRELADLKADSKAPTEAEAVPVYTAACTLCEYVARSTTKQAYADQQLARHMREKHRTT